MKLLVISDVHGRADRVRQVLDRQISPADAVLFLGDGYTDISRIDMGQSAFFAVRGNCDFSFFTYTENLPHERMLNLGAYNILMMHGDRYGVGYGADRASAYAASKGADILLYGHTHIKYEQYLRAGELVGGKELEKNLYVFNPGSLGSPRDGGKPSFGLIELRENGIIGSWGQI